MKIDTFLEQSPLFAVSRAGRKFEAQLAQVFAEENVNFLEALVLVSIQLEEPNRVNPSKLADTFSTTRGNISHCLSSLEAKGLISRKIDPEDARAFHLLLKPQGKKMAMQVIRILDHLQRSFEKSVGVTQIKSALKVVRDVQETFGRMSR
jgi:DNA-binding MarR family transcriptional regulator